ncbi:MAG: outer rane efflux protein [Phycisphaerales bacterium]|nr:outer rane efflux protein [Phycisphaerales bacterium]
MRVLRWLAATALMLGAAGCVNQRAEIAKYRKFLNEGVLTNVPELVRGEELTLERAILLANQDNENLMIRGEDFIQAMNDKDRAFAQFLPTISISPNYTIVDNSSASQTSTTSNGVARPVGTAGGFKTIGKTLRRFEVPAVASGNLFHGFRDLQALEAEDWTIEQRRQLMLDAQATLFLEVAQAYYQVLLAERSIDVLTRSLAAQQERVRDAQGKINAGTGKPLDLAQAEAQAASTRVSVVQARGDAANARTLLAFLIGTREVSGPLRDNFPVPAQPLPIEELLSQGWTSREDYKAAQAAVEAATYNVQAAIGEYYPSVSLNITGYLFRENYADASKWNTLLQVNIPIFSAGVIEADVRTAWSRLRQAALAQSLIRRQVEQEVQQRYQNYLTSTSKLRELDAQIRAATEAYRQAKAGFDAGTAIYLEVLTAQNVLLDSELQVATEAYNQKVIYLDLLRTTGRIKYATVQHPTTGPTTAPATMPTTMPAR